MEMYKGLHFLVVIPAIVLAPGVNIGKEMFKILKVTSQQRCPEQGLRIAGVTDVLFKKRG